MVQLRNPIRSGEMIKGEGLGRVRMAGAAASRPAEPAPRPAWRRRGRAAGGAQCPGWAAGYAELSSGTIFSSPPPGPCPCRRAPGPLP